MTLATILRLGTAAALVAGAFAPAAGAAREKPDAAQVRLAIAHVHRADMLVKAEMRTAEAKCMRLADEGALTSCLSTARKAYTASTTALQKELMRLANVTGLSGSPCHWATQDLFVAVGDVQFASSDLWFAYSYRDRGKIRQGKPKLAAKLAAEGRKTAAFGAKCV